MNQDMNKIPGQETKEVSEPAKRVPIPKPRRKTIDCVTRATMIDVLKPTSQEPAKAEQPNGEKLKSTNRLTTGSTSSKIEEDRIEPETSAHQRAGSETNIDYTKYDYAKVSLMWESKFTHGNGKNEENVKSTEDGLRRTQSLSHGIRGRISYFQQNKVEQLDNVDQQSEAKEEVEQQDKVEQENKISQFHHLETTAQDYRDTNQTLNTKTNALYSNLHCSRVENQVSKTP